MSDLTTPLSDIECEQLDDFLLSVEHDDAVLNLSEFDGFVTAVVSGPETIMPSTWMPELWGGENNAPVWESIEDYEFIFDLMIRHMNSTAMNLLEDPASFEPMFMESVINGDTHWVVDEWCVGYVKGVSLFPSSTAVIPEFREMLAPIQEFASEDGWISLEGKDRREIRVLQERIAPAARAIHAYWLAQRHPSTAAKINPYIRSESKVGRNDLCPCGSGKKYKKCCGGAIH